MTPSAIDTLVAACRKDIAQAGSNPLELQAAIVNTPFKHRLETTTLGLGIVVLLIRNQATATLDRIALSRTEQASGATTISVKKFREIRIPLDCHENSLIQTLDSGQHQIVSDWKYIFIPALTPEEARLNQAGAAIACSVVYPLLGFDKGGAMIFSYFEPAAKLTAVHHQFMAAYSQICADALEQSHITPQAGS